MPQTLAETKASLATLFDLVAPIFITGAADVSFERKAISAWTKIAAMNPDDFAAAGCPSPLKAIEEVFADAADADMSDIDLKDRHEWDVVYANFAEPAYNALFRAIVHYHGDSNWSEGVDYWGAMGFERPGDTSRTFSLVGSTSGYFPFYETADLLVDAVKAGEVK